MLKEIKSYELIKSIEYLRSVGFDFSKLENYKNKEDFFKRINLRQVMNEHHEIEKLFVGKRCITSGNNCNICFCRRSSQFAGCIVVDTNHNDLSSLTSRHVIKQHKFTFFINNILLTRYSDHYYNDYINKKLSSEHMNERKINNINSMVSTKCSMI